MLNKTTPAKPPPAPLPTGEAKVQAMVLNKNIWLIIAIQTAIAAAEGIVVISSLSETQKTALHNLILAGEEVLTVF